MAKLKAGTLSNFTGSMAEAMEQEMQALIGPLPDSPDEVKARRVMFIAISRGVVRHMKDQLPAFVVQAPVIINAINTTVNIQFEDV
jgi:hypothetical protein